MEYYFGRAAQNIYLLSQIPDEDWKFVEGITKDQLKWMPEILMNQLHKHTEKPKDDNPLLEMNLDFLISVYRKYQENKHKEEKRARKFQEMLKRDEELVKKTLYVGEPGFLEQELEKKKEAYEKALETLKGVKKVYVGQPGYDEYCKIEEPFVKARDEYIEQELLIKKNELCKMIAEEQSKVSTATAESKDETAESKVDSIESKDDADGSKSDIEDDYVIYNTHYDQFLLNLEKEWKFVHNFFEITIDADKKEITMKRKNPQDTVYKSIVITGSKASLEIVSGSLYVVFTDDDDHIYESGENVLGELDGFFENLNPSG